MQERTCPSCGQPAYSAVKELDWTCPNCFSTIPVKQNGPQELTLQTDREEIQSNHSIPQKHTLLEMLCDGDKATTVSIFAEARNYVRVCDLI